MHKSDVVPMNQNAGLWDSKAKAKVLESLRRAQFLHFERWRKQWGQLHAMYDGEFEAIIKERLALTHPERAKELSHSLRFVDIVRAWVERLSVIFHRPAETFLHTGDGVPLDEDHPAVKQWRKDSKQIRLHETLSQIEHWTNLLGNAFVQVAFVKGSELRWMVHSPREIWVDQDPQLPDEIEDAFITCSIRKPLDTIGAHSTGSFITWTKESGQWMCWVHDGHGKQMVNTLFADNVSQYGGHPFVVFRRERPSPGSFYVPPSESLLELAISSCLKIIDSDWINRFQCHSQAVIVGHMSDEFPTIGPSRVLHFPDRDASFSYVSPGSATGLAELRESFNFDLRLAAVAAGMAPDTFEPQSSTRNLASKQLENYQLTLKREKAIPAYMNTVGELWRVHKRVADYWASVTGDRVAYGDLQLGMNLAPIPTVQDRFQSVQANIQELNAGLTSPVELVSKQEGCTRQEALRRVAQRQKDYEDIKSASGVDIKEDAPPPAPATKAAAGQGVPRPPSVRKGD